MICQILRHPCPVLKAPHFVNHCSKQQLFLCFLSITTNSWKAVCVCPTDRAVYQGWEADELGSLPVQQLWTIRGPWYFSSVQTLDGKDQRVQRGLKPSQEWSHERIKSSSTPRHSLIQLHTCCLRFVPFRSVFEVKPQHRDPRTFSELFWSMKAVVESRCDPEKWSQVKFSSSKLQWKPPRACTRCESHLFSLLGLDMPIPSVQILVARRGMMRSAGKME